MSTQPGPNLQTQPPKPARPVISQVLTITFAGAVFANLILVGFLILRLGRFEDTQKRAEEASQELAKTRDQIGTLQQDLKTLEEKKAVIAPQVEDWQKRVQEKAAAEAALTSLQERQQQVATDINQSSNRLQQLNAVVTGLATQKASVAGDLQKLRSDLDLVTRSNIDVRAVLIQAADAERRRSEAQTATDSASSTLKQVEADILVGRSTLEKNQKQADDLRQSREKLATEIASLQQQAESLKLYVASNQTTAAEVAARQDAVQKANQSLAKAREHQSAAEAQAAEAAERSQKLTADLTNLVSRVEAARKDAADAEPRRTSLRTDVQSAEQDLAALRKTLAEAGTARDSLTRETSRLETQVQRLNVEKQALQKEIGQLEAQRPNPASTNK